MFVVLWKKLRNENPNYLYDTGDEVFIYDTKMEKIIKLVVRHRMTGDDYSDWEYYNCIDPLYTDESEDNIYEISQKYLFATMRDIQQHLIWKKLS